MSWRGTSPGPRILAGGRRRTIANNSCSAATMGKDMNRKELLQGFVAGDGHEDHVVREQLLAYPGYHAGAGGEEGGNRQKSALLAF